MQASDGRKQILALFHPSHMTLQPRFATSQSHLRALTPLTTGQVLCVLRLVVHASAGRSTRSEGVDLTFRQGPSSPSLAGVRARNSQEVLTSEHAWGCCAWLLVGNQRPCHPT